MHSFYSLYFISSHFRTSFSLTMDMVLICEVSEESELAQWKFQLGHMCNGNWVAAYLYFGNWTIKHSLIVSDFMCTYSYWSKCSYECDDVGYTMVKGPPSPSLQGGHGIFRNATVHRIWICQKTTDITGSEQIFLSKLTQYATKQKNPECFFHFIMEVDGALTEMNPLAQICCQTSLQAVLTWMKSESHAAPMWIPRFHVIQSSLNLCF